MSNGMSRTVCSLMPHKNVYDFIDIFAYRKNMATIKYL